MKQQGLVDFYPEEQLKKCATQTFSSVSSSPSGSVAKSREFVDRNHTKPAKVFY